MAVETKYKKGDTIYWYCNTDDEVHHAEVQFVNYIPVGFPEINYEVETICCGEYRCKVMLQGFACAGFATVEATYN